MNLRDQYEQETGKKATYNIVKYAGMPTPDYVQWLEAKLQKPEVSEGDIGPLSAEERNNCEAWEKGYKVGFEAGKEYGTSAAYEG